MSAHRGKADPRSARELNFPVRSHPKNSESGNQVSGSTQVKHQLT
jgi:hypothetical protein